VLAGMNGTSEASEFLAALLSFSFGARFARRFWHSYSDFDTFSAQIRPLHQNYSDGLLRSADSHPITTATLLSFLDSGNTCDRCSKMICESCSCVCGTCSKALCESCRGDHGAHCGTVRLFHALSVHAIPVPHGHDSSLFYAWFLSFHVQRRKAYTHTVTLSYTYARTHALALTHTF
jgi:hypothetical protein